MEEAPSKLEYATLPANSCIDVADEGDALVLSQRPVGWWFNARWGLAYVLIHIMLSAGFILWIVLRHDIPAEFWQLPHIYPALPWLVIALVLVFGFCFVAGRFWMTIRLKPHTVEIIRGLSLLSHTWSRQRTVPWERIDRIQCRRFGSTIDLFDSEGKLIVHLILQRRGDAQWLAQLLSLRVDQRKQRASTV